jgi:translation initiation factor IF-1
MVKNEKGGGKGKKIARKHTSKGSDNLRLSSNKLEKYAYVKKLLGNTCDIVCDDGIERRCVIRGKFSGRFKRDNLIEQGKWILVGLREWINEDALSSEYNSNKEKVELCDLLEVYSQAEQEKLKRSHNVFENVREAHVLIDTEESKELTVEFLDESTYKYKKMIQNEELCGEQTRKISMKKKILSSNIITQDFSDISDDDQGDDEGDDDEGHDDEEDDEYNSNNIEKIENQIKNINISNKSIPSKSLSNKYDHEDEIDVDDI